MPLPYSGGGYFLRKKRGLIFIMRLRYAMRRRVFENKKKSVEYRGFKLVHDDYDDVWTISPFHPAGGANDYFRTLQDAKDFIDRNGSDFDPKWWDESFTRGRVLESSYGWEIKRGKEWDAYEEALEIFGAESLVDQIAQAMRKDDLGETIAFIYRNNDIESEFLDD